MVTTGIIVAGGPGTRLGAPEPKGFVALAGVPLMARALRALLAAQEIDAAVVVVPRGARERGRALIATHGPWRCGVAVVEGGAERQDSVRAGLEAAGTTDLVAIHDAARPFVPPAVVTAVIAAAARYGAAIAALPATDPVKYVHPDGWIETTPDRQRVWLAQTPQAFRADLLRRAHAQAQALAGPATDDAVLVERLGERVYVVAGAPENRKITTPDDLRWAAGQVARA
jgi:2-C-methyl-D-erythritol 4-phosphate cytidylyltransferase